MESKCERISSNTPQGGPQRPKLKAFLSCPLGTNLFAQIFRRLEFFPWANRPESMGILSQFRIPRSLILLIAPDSKGIASANQKWISRPLKLTWNWTALNHPAEFLEINFCCHQTQFPIGQNPSRFNFLNPA